MGRDDTLAVDVKSAPDLLGAVLPELLSRAPLTPEKVTFAWRAAVGPALARATTVRLRPNGTLEVTTPDPRWGLEVERASYLVLPRLKAMLGDANVTRIATRRS